MSRKTLPPRLSRGGGGDPGRHASRDNFEDQKLNVLVKKLIREDYNVRGLEVDLKQLREYIEFTCISGNLRLIAKYADSAWNKLQELFYKELPKTLKLEVAEVIGLLGLSLGADASRYSSWIFNCISGAPSEQVKSYYLYALQRTVEIDVETSAPGRLANLMPELMTNLRKLLEAADDADLLEGVVNTVLAVAINYPNIFQSHFEETVDIIVGWHIDAAQSQKTVDFTGNVLLQFHPFWVGNCDYSLHLLCQFLDDIEAYRSDIDGPHAGEDVYKGVFEKIVALINVFGVVVQGFGKLATSLNSRSIIEKCIQRATSCVVEISNSYYHYPLISQTNKMLCEVNSAIPALIVGESSADGTTNGIAEMIFNYIFQVLSHDPAMNPDVITSCLNTIKEIIDASCGQIPLPLFEQLFIENDRLQNFRFCGDEAIMDLSLEVYQAALFVKDVPTLETVYKIILSEIQSCCIFLVQQHCSGEDVLRTTASLHIVSDPYQFTITDSAIAEKIIVFNLTSLSLLTAQKTSLIANYALKPSLFDLFSKVMKVMIFDYGSFFPAIQYTICYLLYSHCSASSHFVNSCTPESSDQSIEESTFSFSVSTRFHFLTVIDFISNCLQLKKLSFDLHFLCLSWLTEALNHLIADNFPQKRFMAIVQSPQYTKMLGAVVDSAAKSTMIDIHETIVDFIMTMKNKLPVDNLIVSRISQLCLIMIQCNKDYIADCYRCLLRELPIGSFARLKPIQPDSLSALFQHKSVRKSLMRRVPNPNMVAYDFKFILDGLFADIDSVQQVDGLSLETLFFKNVKNYEKEINDLMDISIQFNDVSWFNAIWEAANYCVIGKLKTAMGKANETFSSFESVLRKLAAVIKANSNVPAPLVTAVLAPRNLPSYGKPQRILLFLDCLEKQLYNASEGLACSLPATSKAARVFFRTNKGTCKTWFRQIRVPAAHLAQACETPAATIYHLLSYLAELAEDDKSLQETTIDAILMLFAALIQTGGADALAGVSIWFQQRFGRSFPFVKAFILHAKGDYESCLKSYAYSPSQVEERTPSRGDRLKKDLYPILDSSPAIMKSVYSHTFSVMNSLSMYDEFVQFAAEFKLKNQDRLGTPFCEIMDRDMKHVEALQSFRSFEFSACKVHLHSALFTDPTSETLQAIPISGNPWQTQDLSRCIDNALLFTASNSACRILEGSTFSSSEISSAERELFMPINNASMSFCELSANACSNTTVNRFLYYRKFSDTILALQKQAEVDESMLQLVHVADSRPDACIIETWGKQLSLMTFYHHMIKSAETNEDSTPPPCSAEFVYDKILATEMTLLKMLRKSNCTEKAVNVILARLKTEVDESLVSDQGGHVQQLKKLLAVISADDGSSSLADAQLISVRKEAAKLFFVCGEELESFNQLSFIIKTFLESREVVGYTVSNSDFVAQCILTLDKWVSADGKYAQLIADHCQGDIIPNAEVSENFQSVIQQSLSRKSDLVNVFSDIRVFNVISESDLVTSSLYDLALSFQKDNANAWFRLASWCFKFGKKLVDHACKESNLLSADEIESATECLCDATLDPETTCDVLAVLGKAHFTALHDEDIGRQDNLYQDGAAAVQRQLLVIAPQLKDFPAVLEALMVIWLKVCKRIFSLYTLCADGYFKYLSLGNTTTDDSNVTATLRLLRLLVKHAWELQTVLESGLASTPTKPWQGICPQLFSRLNHPEAYVRKSVADLLSRLAEESPHLIVYPVIVGCEQKISEGKMKAKSAVLKKMMSSEDDENLIVAEEELVASQGDMKSQVADETVDDVDTAVLDTGADEDDDEDDEEDEGDVDDGGRAEIEHCYSLLLDTLSHHDTQLVSDVQLFVNELRRVSVLWDELWLSALMHYSSEVAKCLSSMDFEKKRLDRNKQLSLLEKNAILTAKYSAYIKPVIFVFDQLLDLTSRQPETQHEKWFVERYLERVKSALNLLKNPPDIRRPLLAWESFDKLHHELLARNSKKSSFALEMKNIAPKLASLKDACIPLMLSGTSELVTIQSFMNAIIIMPTKTKPKKLSIIGNNGKTYSYLFKGLEDLHLDERIMQFLSIINTMFEKSNKQDNTPYFRARNYAVTPLGPRSGLIQWVDGATPLFGLYKKWQQREVLATVIKKQQQQQAAVANMPGVKPIETTIPPVQRPSELYHSKVVSALTAIGAAENTPRKDWPACVLTEVLEELIKETPNFLLSKEMWCSCSNTDEWWMMVQQFNHCNALMSVVGYIIGLGDRHLDNILVDLSTGEVVHIDYNVCFEKGRNLRVPEKVPFRLTQNIQNALGMTGYEGMFRCSAENVLRVLKKGREALLTLLEAFVYDPLVDWTHSSDIGFIGALQFKKNTEVLKAEKKEMDFNISHNLLSAKMLEIRTIWQKNCDDVQRVMNRLPDCVGNVNQNYSSYEETEKQQTLLENAKSYLGQAGVSDKHAFWTLRERIENASFYQNLEDEFDAKVNQQISVCEAWIAQVDELFSNFESGTVNELRKCISEEVTVPRSGFIESQTYLKSVNQMHLFEECQAAETEFMASFEQLRKVSKDGATALHKYLSIISQLPKKPNLVHSLLQYCNDIKTDHAISAETYLDKINEFKVLPLPLIEQAVLFDSLIMVELKEETDLTVDFTSKLQAVAGSNLTGWRELSSSAQNEQNRELARFIGEKGDERNCLLVTTIISYIASLGKQYMTMEYVAFSAESSVLKNLRSVEGDWFLDEIELLSFNLCNLVKLLLAYLPHSVNLPSITPHVDAVIAAFRSYSLLTDLYQNIIGRVIPECIQNFSTFNQQPGDAELKESFKSVLFEVYSEGISFSNSVERALLGQAIDAESMESFEKSVELLKSFSTPGSVLSLLLHYFNQLDCEFEELVTVTLASKHPDEASAMLRHIESVQVSGQVMTVSRDDLVLTKSLKTWLKCHSILSICGFLLRMYTFVEQMDRPTENPLRLSDVLDPIRSFIAGFVRKEILGLPLKCLTNLILQCSVHIGINLPKELRQAVIDEGAEVITLDMIQKRARDHVVASYEMSSDEISLVTKYFTELEGISRQITQVNMLEKHQSSHRRLYELLRICAIKSQWTNYHYLLAGGKVDFVPSVLGDSRHSVLGELRIFVDGFKELALKAKNLFTEFNSREDKIAARLKWSAGLYKESLERVSSLRSVQYEAVNRQLDVLDQIFSMCQIVFQAEEVQIPASKIDTYISDFLQIIQLSQKMNSHSSQKVSIGEVERHILEKHSSETHFSDESRKTVLQVVEKDAKAQELSLNTRRASLNRSRDELKLALQPMRHFLNTHNKLMGDIKNLMRPLNREEDSTTPNTRQVASMVRQYISDHNLFTENILKLFAQTNILIGNRDPISTTLRNDSTILPTIQSTISVLLELMPLVYNNLMTIATPLTTAQDDSQRPSFAAAVSGAAKVASNNLALTGSAQATVSERPPVIVAKPVPCLRRDPRTGKALQERNAYAISVWHKVKFKLDGRESEVQKRMSVPEHIDSIIQASVSMDNLAQMYEGWTAWV